MKIKVREEHNNVWPEGYMILDLPHVYDVLSISRIGVIKEVHKRIQGQSFKLRYLKLGIDIYIWASKVRWALVSLILTVFSIVQNQSYWSLSKHSCRYLSLGNYIWKPILLFYLCLYCSQSKYQGSYCLQCRLAFHSRYQKWMSGLVLVKSWQLWIYLPVS